MKLKKVFSIVMTMLILLTSIPLDVNFAGTNMQKEQFYSYAKGLGYSKTTLYFEQLDNQDFKSSLTLNYNIYAEYNVVVYGSPHGDLKSVRVGSKDVKEYRYLGYDILGHSVTNARFPNDATVTPISDWKFVSANGSDSWLQPLVTKNPTFKAKLWNQQISGHGTTTLTPAIIGQNKATPEDYSRIETLPGKMVQGSFLAKHKDRDGKVWYGTFDSPKLPIDVNGAITTPADTYTLAVGQQSITVPVTISSTLSLPDYIKPAQIQNVTAAYGGQTFKATGAATVSGTKNMVLSRTNYAAGNYKVTLNGVAGAILWNNEPVSKPVTKNITLIVLSDPPKGKYVSPAAKATPDNVKFTGVDIPVVVKVDGVLKGVSDPSKVAYWDFYCKMDQDSSAQKKTANGPNLSSTASFNFTIPKSLVSGDYYTQGFSATVRVFLTDGTYYDAPAGCSTYVYKSLPQPNPASTPHAIITAPDRVKAGDSFAVSGKSSYSEGSTIVAWSWGTDANKSVMTDDQSSGTLTYDNWGEQTIRLDVDDALNNSDNTSKKITVLPPKPDAVLTIGGNLKANRKIILDASSSMSPERFPIVWAKSRLTLKAVDAGLTDSDIKLEGTATGFTLGNALAKKPGNYSATLYVENTAGFSDEQTFPFVIEPDQDPLVQFYTVNTVYRDPTDSNQASINLVFWDSPVDGDPIIKRTLKYAYDSNNNGSFDDESWVTVDVTGKDSYALKTDEVGKYKFETWAKEDFGQPTIDAFVVPEDRKIGTTQGVKPDSEKIVEVANMPPAADFRVGPKPDVDILFVMGTTSVANSTVDSYFNSYIKPKFDTRKFGYKYGIYRGTISDALKNYTFKETAKRYVVYIHGAAVAEMTDQIKAGNITAMLLSRDATLYGVGNAGNISDLQKLVAQNNGNGKVFYDSDLPGDFSSMGDLISDWIPADIFFNLGLSSYTDVNLVKARWAAIALPKLNAARIDAKVTLNEGITKFYDKLDSYWGYTILKSSVSPKATGGLIHPIGLSDPLNTMSGVAKTGFFTKSRGAEGIQPAYWKGNTTSDGYAYPSDINSYALMCSDPTRKYRNVVLKDGSCYLSGVSAWKQTSNGQATWTAPSQLIDSNAAEARLAALDGKGIKWGFFDDFIDASGNVYVPDPKVSVLQRTNYGTSRNPDWRTLGIYWTDAKIEGTLAGGGGIVDLWPYSGTYVYGQVKPWSQYLVLRADGSLSICDDKGSYKLVANGVVKVAPNFVSSFYDNSYYHGYFNNLDGYFLTNDGKVYYLTGNPEEVGKKFIGSSATTVTAADTAIPVPLLDNIVDLSAYGRMSGNTAALPNQEIQNFGFHALRSDGSLYGAGGIALGWGSSCEDLLGDGSSYGHYDPYLIPNANGLHFNGKSLLDEYTKTNYRAQASKYFLNLADGNIADLGHPLGAKMAAEDVAYVGMGKPTDQAQVNNFLATEKLDGIFIDNSNLDASINAAVDYIIKNTSRDGNRKESILIRGEQVEYNWYSDDAERDKIIGERWRFDHTNPNYFENGNGTDSRSGQTLAAPITTFDRKGQYSGFYQVQDQPKNDPNFSNYNLWTLDYPETLLVHDRPIAFFYLNVQVDGSYTLGDWSYDPDHTSRGDKGLVSRKWQYKEVGSNQWLDGIPTSPIDPAKKYVVQLTVKDMEGAWSLPYSRVMAYIPMTLTLALNPTTLPASESTTATVTVNSPVEVNRVWGYMNGEIWAEMTKINATQWQVPYPVPATKPDGPYQFYAFTDIGGNVNAPFTVLTPVNLVPALQSTADTGSTITTTSTTSKYVNKVTLRAFKGTAKEQLINMTGGTGNWSTPITVPDITDGTYNFEYVATTPNGNSQTVTKQLTIKTLGITGTMLPNDPMAGDQLIFNVHTVGGADKLELILEPSIISSDNRAAMGYAPITYPYIIPVNGSIAVKDTTFTYILWCNTPQSKTLKGVVNRAPYTFVVRSWKGSSYKDLTIVRDVTGDVRQVLKPGLGD